MTFLFLAVIILTVTGGANRSLPPRPLYQMEGADKTVLFTFNILWDVEEELEAVLTYLQAHKIEAVFFVTGEWVKMFPESAIKILEHEQHLGNRSVSHRRLILLTEEEIAAEIKGFNQICQEMPGYAYTPSFFRPPHGEYNSRIVRLAKEADCLTLLWSINARTMTDQQPAFIINHLEERLHPGAIILFHLSPGVARSLPLLVDFLTWKGYTIGSPRQLLR
ncbi:MAG: polysaccharide deacetylase family protein [Bacillota bacterium]